MGEGRRLVDVLGDCAECWDHYYAHDPWHWAAAFSTVGIEHGRGSADEAETYFRSFHKTGHRTLPTTGDDDG